MTALQTAALAALIEAGAEMAEEMADEVADFEASDCRYERELVSRWQNALRAFRGEQLEMFAEAAA